MTPALELWEFIKMNVRMDAENNGSPLMARAAWMLAAILAGLCFLSIYHQPVGWGPPLVVTALALGAASRPYDALLVLAGLGPLAAAVFGLTRTGSVSLNFAEALTLAFLAGCAARRGVQPRSLVIPAPVRWSAIILLTLALASGIVNATIIRTENPDSSVTELVKTYVTNDYLVSSNTLTSTMLFMEGLLLLLIVADTCARECSRRDGVLRMMVLGASVSALLNVLKILTSALGQDDPWRTFLRYLATVRLNVLFGDLNAAGSYFAMLLFVAMGFVPRARVPAILASIVMAAGLWIAGSRTALAAVLLTVALGATWGLVLRRHRKIPAIALLALLVVVTVGGWKWYPQGRNLGAGDALSYRILMGKAAVRMTAAHPFFGVGLGRFYALSGQVENAHNNFLQISAELGVPALMLFVAIPWFAIRAAWRGAGPPDPTWGLIAGLLTFLVTCLAGHPLLVAGAAYPFWMALGLAASVDVRTGAHRSGHFATIVVVLIIAATLPLRIAAAVREANVEHASVGLSLWQREPDGSRYRWAGRRSSFFVAASARAIRIPLRRGPLAPATLEVRIFLDGVEADRVVLRQDDESRTVRLVLARRVAARFSRIDLECRIPGAMQSLDAQPTQSAGVLMVGRPVEE